MILGGHDANGGAGGGGSNSGSFITQLLSSKIGALTSLSGSSGGLSGAGGIGSLSSSSSGGSSGMTPNTDTTSDHAFPSDTDFSNNDPDQPININAFADAGVTY